MQWSIGCRPSYRSGGPWRCKSWGCNPRRRPCRPRGHYDISSGIGPTLTPQAQHGMVATATTSTLQGMASTLAPRASQCSLLITATPPTQIGLSSSTAPSTQRGLGASSGRSQRQMAGPSVGQSGAPIFSADPAQIVGIPTLPGDMAEEFRLFKLIMEMRKGSSLTTVATVGPAIQAVQVPPPVVHVTQTPTQPSNPPVDALAFGQYPSHQAQLLQRAVQPVSQLLQPAPL